MESIDEKARKGLISEAEYNTLNHHQQQRYNTDSIPWEADRLAEKRKVVELNDVKISFKSLMTGMTEMPDIEKIPLFTGILIDNRITKWQLRVATAEILRTRTKFIAVCDYFLAIDRVKVRLRASNTDFYHSDKGLDF